MNYDSVADDLLNLIDSGLETTRAILPYQKGNSIRIKNYAIRKNSKGYQIYNVATNSRVATTNFKISALALAKSLAEGVNATDRILFTDSELLKHYNDALFYRHKMNKTTDFSVLESRLHRLDISIAKSKVLKGDLDRFIF
jgi:hypothetical protein